MSDSEKPKNQPKTVVPADAVTFSYDTAATAEEVMQALADLEWLSGFIKHDVVFTPVLDGYDFRYNIVRSGRGAGISASAQGRIRRNGDTTHVAGSISKTPENYLLILVIAVIAIIINILLVIPVLFVGGIFMLADTTQRGDVKRISSNIANAIANADVKHGQHYGTAPFDNSQANQ